MKYSKFFAFCVLSFVLSTSHLKAQDNKNGETKPSQDVAPLTSVYQIDLGINVEELEKTPRFQQLLKQTSITTEEDKQTLINLICQEALQSLKLELIHCNATWWTPENSNNVLLEATLTAENIEDIENCFPKNSWIKPKTTLLTTKPNYSAWREKIVRTKVAEENNRFLGLTYRDAVQIVLKEKLGMCRLKSVDGVEITNPYKDDNDFSLMIFEVEGGRVIHAILKTKKL